MIRGLTLRSTDRLSLFEEIVETIADDVEISHLIHIILVVSGGTSKSVVAFEISINLLVLVLITLLS